MSKSKSKGKGTSKGTRSSRLPVGVVPSLPTPFLVNGDVDLPGMAALVEQQIRAGVHGVAVLGAMGEVAYLLPEERGAVVRAAVERVAGTVPVVVGISTGSTRQAVVEGCEARELGAAGLLVSLPGAHRIPFPNVLSHFRTLATESGLPVVLDRSAAATRWDFSDRELTQLLELGGLQGLREARSRPLNDLRAQAERAESLSLYVGNLGLLPDALDLGAVGTICAVVCLCPEEVVTLYEAYQDGDMVVAHHLTNQLTPIVPALFGAKFSHTVTRGLLKVARAGLPMPRVNEPVMSAIKYGLSLQGVPITPRVRKPLPEVNARQRARIRSELIRLGLVGTTGIQEIG